jgi:hypothetical protein
MGIASSVFVFAIGAFMRFAVSVTSTHFNVQTIGVILMIVGGVGLVVEISFWSTSEGVGGYRGHRSVVGADGVTRQEREEGIQRP